LRKLLEQNAVKRLVKLLIEIVNPELFEVAQDNVPWPIWDGSNPIIECLLVVKREILSRAFHFKQEPGLPDEVNKLLSFCSLLGYTGFKRGTGLFVPFVAKSLKQTITEHLRFALLIDKRTRVLNECFEAIYYLRQMNLTFCVKF
jgi:hypothetical protein